MAKAKPIRDMNGSQWTRYEGAVIRRLKSGTGDGDRDIAVRCLDSVFGRKNKEGDVVPPSGGYSTDLMDGASRLVEVRRKQIQGTPHD